MKRILPFAFVIPLLVAGCTSSRYGQDERLTVEADTPALTKEDVIALSREDVDEDQIIDQIRATHSYFELSNDDIIELNKAGVSEKVISAMIKTSESAQPRRATVDPYNSYLYYDYPYQSYLWQPSLSFRRLDKNYYYYYYPYSQQRVEPSSSMTTKENVIALVVEGVGDDVIIDQIRATSSVFELSPDDVVDLMEAGVSKRLIRGMRSTRPSGTSGGRVSRYYYAAYYFPLGRTPWIWSKYYNNYYVTPIRR